jgi:hypothetical protein
MSDGAHDATSDIHAQTTVGEIISTRQITEKENTRSLRVQNRPSISAPVISGLNRNQSVVVMAQSNDGAWYFVIAEENTVGWVAADDETLTP